MRTTISHVVFWTLAGIVILLMVFLGIQPVHAGELYTVTTLRSYHVDRNVGNKTGVLGFQVKFNVVGF